MKKKHWAWIAGNIPELISAIALTGAIGITVVNVISRYIFSKAIIGVEEFVSICFCWSVFSGAAAAYKRKMHFGIEALVDILPDRLQRVVKVFVRLLLLVSCAYITYLCWVLADAAWVKTTSYYRIPYFYVDASMIFGFGCITYYTLKELVYEFVLKKPVRYVDVEDEAFLPGVEADAAPQPGQAVKEGASA